MRITPDQLAELTTRLREADPLGAEGVPVVVEWLEQLTPADTGDTITTIGQRLYEQLSDNDRRGGALSLIVAALTDAHDLGAMSVPEPAAAPAERTAFGQPADPAARQGFVIRVVHTIEASQITEHGPELVIMAWLQQTLRELAANASRQEFSFDVMTMPEGTVVVTGEAPA